MRQALLVLVAVLILASCGAPGPSTLGGSPQGDATPSSGAPQPTEVAGGPPLAAQASLDGVNVTLAIDRGRVETGGIVTAVATIVNLGLGPVTWRSGGCELFHGFSLSGPAVPQPPPGRDWPGTAHWAKWAATDGEARIASFLPPGAFERGDGFACTAELRVEDTPPGGTETVEAEWPAIVSHGTGAPAGRYVARFEFPYLGRVAADQFRGDPHADVRPIAVELPIDVVGIPEPLLPSTLAFDAALADPRVGTWIATITRQELNGASIRLVDGLWHVLIRTQRGDAGVELDARSGAIRTVVLP